MLSLHKITIYLYLPSFNTPELNYLGHNVLGLFVSLCVNLNLTYDIDLYMVWCSFLIHIFLGSVYITLTTLQRSPQQGMVIPTHTLFKS